MINLIDKKVTHKVFGEGSVARCDDSVIEIKFATESKLFVFPDVFGTHLQVHDAKDAQILEEILQDKESERKEHLRKKEEEQQLHVRTLQLRSEHEKLMKNHKLHPESQMVYWCDADEITEVFTDWRVSSGLIKSGSKKGMPNKPIRLHQNSAVVLTTRDANVEEKDRRIIGLYMVNEEFIGKLSEDGEIPAHSKYKLALTDEESKQLYFWNYYENKKSPDKMAWHTGKHRYFDNLWTAQILADIVALKNDPEEQQFAEQFLKHFCISNQIMLQDLPKPNGTLIQSKN